MRPAGSLDKSDIPTIRDYCLKIKMCPLDVSYGLRTWAKKKNLNLND